MKSRRLIELPSAREPYHTIHAARAVCAPQQISRLDFRVGSETDILGAFARCPLYPRKQTFGARVNSGNRQRGKVF
jgi:hypothetical protein